MTDKIHPQDLLDFSAVATFAINPEHEVICWNKSCEILTGVKSPDVMGTRNHWKPFYNQLRPCLADVVITGDFGVLPELYEKYWELPLVPGGLHAEGWYENLGGKRRYIIFDAAPVFNKIGELIAAIETLHDITEEKQLEENKEIIFRQLQEKIAKMDSLKGYVPICASCKNVRTTEKAWIPIEEYISQRTELQFSHGICPDCAKKQFPEFYKKK